MITKELLTFLVEEHQYDSRETDEEKNEDVNDMEKEPWKCLYDNLALIDGFITKYFYVSVS